MQVFPCMCTTRNTFKNLRNMCCRWLPILMTVDFPYKCSIKEGVPYFGNAWVLSILCSSVNTVKWRQLRQYHPTFQDQGSSQWLQARSCLHLRTAKTRSQYIIECLVIREAVPIWMFMKHTARRRMHGLRRQYEICGKHEFIHSHAIMELGMYILQTQIFRLFLHMI